MKKIIIIFINIFFCINLYSVEYKNKEVITLAFLNQFQLLKDFSEAKDSLGTWIENVGRKRNVNMKVKFYENINELYKDFQDKKLDMIVVSAEYFFLNKNQIEQLSKNFWSLAYEENREYKYCLISNKKQKFNDMNDLKNKSFIMKSFDITANDWLDYMSLNEAQKSYKKLPKEIKYETKESTVLLNVFFNKFDYGVVRKNTWSTMLELNPSIVKNVNLIKCSETNFVPFVGFFRNNIDEEIVKIFYDTAGKLTNYDDSEQIFTLLNFDHIFELDKIKLDSLDKFYSYFQQLKGKYN